MSTLLKFAVATAMITVTVGLGQAQQTGRSIEVIPAVTEAQGNEQTVAQAPEAPAAEAPAPEAPAPEAPAAAEPAPEQAAPQQAAPVPQAVPVPPAARAEQIPVKPVKPIPAPAPKVVEKCASEKPVYGHAPRYHAPRHEYGYAPRHDYAPRYHHSGYGYRRGY